MNIQSLEKLKNDKTSQRYILIVLILTILLGGGILIFQYHWSIIENLPTLFLKKAKNETADWQTYRNEEYGFEVKYPSNWYPKLPREETSLNSLFFVTFSEQDNYVWPGSFTVSVYRKSPSQDLSSWIIDITPKKPTGSSLVDKILETRLDDLPAKDVEIFGFDHTAGAIVAEKGSYIYWLGFEKGNPNDPDFASHSIIYNQILSTFKFIE